MYKVQKYMFIFCWINLNLFFILFLLLVYIIMHDNSLLLFWFPRLLTKITIHSRLKFHLWVFFLILQYTLSINGLCVVLQIWLTSDLMDDVTCTVNVEMWDIETSRKLSVWNFTSSVPTLRSVSIWTEKITTLNKIARDKEVSLWFCVQSKTRNCRTYALLDLIQSEFSKCVVVCNAKDTTTGREVTNLHTLIEFKTLKLTRPKIQMDILQLKTNEIEIQLTSDRIAPFVYLSMNSLSGSWSDNGFWLFPNQPKTVMFSLDKSLEVNLTTVQLKTELQVISLRDSYWPTHFFHVEACTWSSDFIE